MMFLLVSALLIVSPGKGHALDLRPHIDPLAKQLLADKHVVGLVIGVYSDGKTQVIGYGETEKGKGVAPDGDTIYEIGSVSKVFTGGLLADLVLRGKVKLDDPMQTYLPEKAKAQLNNPAQITFEHLATHTSGLPKLPDNFRPADWTNPYADYSFKQMFAFLKDHQVGRRPGEFEYSNFGMGVMGVLLASRERMSYEELLVDRIAKPCDMDDTRVKLSHQQRRRLAPPYDAALQASQNWDVPTLAGAGGIRSTANDMLKFIAANFADDDKPLTKALKLSHEKRHEMSDGQAIGLAWHMYPDGLTHWHNGKTGGYAAWLSVLPGHDLGIVVLSNTAADQITEIGGQLTHVAFREKSSPSAASPVAKISPEVLQSYVGEYAITPEFALTVTLAGDKLMVQGTGQPKLQLDPESKTRFLCKAVDARIFFVADKRGKINHLVLHQNGANQTATRQAPAAVSANQAAEFPKRAPYTGVRWEGGKPVVKIGEEWFTLVSLDEIAAADIVAFSRRTYKDKWQMRFEEDLVEVLTKMGHEPKDTVQLVVSPLGSSEKRNLDHVPMTEANRDAIRAAAADRTVQIAPEVLEKYVGLYSITPQFALTVTLEGDKLMVQATGQQNFQVYPESETKFFYKVVEAQLTFVGDKNGKAEYLILHQNGANKVATRQD